MSSKPTSKWATNDDDDDLAAAALRKKEKEEKRRLKEERARKTVAAAANVNANENASLDDSERPPKRQRTTEDESAPSPGDAVNLLQFRTRPFDPAAMSINLTSSTTSKRAPMAWSRERVGKTLAKSSH